ncbi:hypothetical protein KAFR_0B00890 [Kazachstania africana CBS 2517]|uniref:ENTH domain-containing protein n=1 Tax=Kazachstania africana (strain ATCC 22294 / BCRC 22015 / CBS 2517 / CECT 1963 / NBRC 1671 / NRRL Y-8276) TaxID=1071382 RepID=H2APT7_KAZAF|nr:hypothetical protein KAFR_0B00890 [Kazachstania africana CBS 2517]CCF56387.1 hypothetical protein KAFR_0B00890 [Kazachstania africana CBS 2517]
MLRSAKNLVKGYSSTQKLVRDATSNSHDNPPIDQLSELAEMTYNNMEFFEIMDMLDKRINSKGKYWKHVIKSLIVLDYLVRFGSENCVIWCKENLYIIKTLREFTYEDESGMDQGQMVRVRAKELTSLLMDEERLREERALNRRGGGNRRRAKSRNSDDDDDLERAKEESRRTAREEEELRRRQEAERQFALQLNQEEQELRALQQLQQQQQQQQQPMYYDIFGNPITPEEYLQFQQRQAALAQQQALLAQQEQQYWAQQQAAFLSQQQQQQQQPLATGSNNPFALNNKKLQQHTPEPSVIDTTLNTQAPLKQTRTGSQSISDKYSALNTLLATGTGIDTFGNTGNQRIPAQHTKTGTFINSQGTGYKQVSTNGFNNVFLNSQYTGLPSSNIVPSQTGYGFGNSTVNNNNLVDL